MQDVSQAYKQSMRQPFRNRGYIRVRIGVVNSRAQENVEARDARNQFAYFSDRIKVFDAYTVDRIYAVGEQNFSKVDGTMYFLPRQDAGLEFYNNGIVTDQLLGSVYISFSGISGLDIKGLTIDFGECYPTRFSITSDSGTKVYENDKALFVTEDVFNETAYFVITPLTMVNGAGRMRIYQFTCGISNNFSNREVKSYSFKDYVSSITETIPSQDMSLTVDNQNLYYSPDNPESTIAYMEQGQEIKTAFGYDVTGTGEIEWLDETTTYLKTWSATDVEAKFTAVDIFDYKLSGTYYRGMYREAGISLYDLAIDVLHDAEITDDREYFVDPYLKDVIVYNPMPAVKHSEALQIIANAGRCVLYVDRQGSIHLQSSFIPDMTASSNGETAYSHVANILVDDAKDAYALQSKDFSTVDGSIFFMPSDGGYLNTGYISAQVSDESGDFEINPKVIIHLEAGFICYGLVIRFRNVAPKEFHICTYYQNSLVQDVIVTDPDLEYATSVHFHLFDRLEFVFTKGQPDTRITLDHVFFGDVTDYTISRKYNLRGTPTATRQNKIKSIVVKRSLYRKSQELKDLFSEERLFDAGDPECIVYFSKASYGMSVVVEDNAAVSAEILDHSDYYARLRFSGIPAGISVKYVIKGYEYLVDEQYVRVAHNGSGEEKTWSNPLISTFEMAKDLEEWLAAYFLGDVDYQITWNGDPRTEANDLFYLELKDREKVLIRAYQNELKFSGAWSGTMKARKAVL